jgi:hypothetical protein
MTRRDRERAAPSFSTLADRHQPSAWARGALYGGGLGIAALVLAIGFMTVRPTPRQRPGDRVAPAWSRLPRQRR